MEVDLWYVVGDAVWGALIGSWDFQTWVVGWLCTG